MPAHDLALLIHAAQKAGEIAKGFFGGSYEVQHKTADGSPVTQADFAVNDMLEAELRAARPDYGWLSEESVDDPARLDAEHVFIIDPIDGTRSFVEGSRTWAHALAIARRGVIEAAVVYLPMKDRLYSAAVGQGAMCNGAALSVSTRADPDGAPFLITRPSLEPRHWPGGVPKFDRHHRPSLAYRLSLVAEGRFDGMATFRPAWEWDIAAGSLLLSEAGARVTDTRGAPLRFNAPHPQHAGVLAAGPDLHDSLLKLILSD